MNIITKILVFVLLTTSLSAQVKFGIKSGFNFSSVTVDGSMDEPTNSRTGFNTGMFFEFYTSKVTAIQIGVDYIQKGCIYKNDNLELTHLINYIEFPVQFNIKFTKSRFCPYTSFGFIYGFITKSVQRQEYTSGEVYDVDTKDLYDGTDFSFVLGLGAQYSISKVFDVFVNCNRSLGTKNTITDLGSEAYPINFGSANNNGYQLTAGFKVRL